MSLKVAPSTRFGRTLCFVFCFMFLAASLAYGQHQTTTPIKHVVVIFQENVSFDHYFATYPKALNPAGEPRFVAKRNTPTVNGLTGVCQTIAIVDAYDDPYVAYDLSRFSSQFGLPAANFTKVTPFGVPSANQGWAGEISLDVQWAHAIAPGAKILLVEAVSSNLGDLLNAVDWARAQAGVSVVSMSWGGSEFLGETAYDSHFTTPAGHSGVTFVASSGDSGSSGAPEYPSVSPNVLAVGGTQFTISGSTLTGEVGWNNHCLPT